MRRRHRRRCGDDRGAELIELAVVLPILMVVFAAIVDFGFLFQRYEVITNAAREGARVGVLPGYVQADVQARVHQYLQSSGLDPASSTVNVSYATQPVGVGGPLISVVNVVVDYSSPFAVLGPIAGMVGGTGWSAITLRAGSTMRMEAAASGS